MLTVAAESVQNLGTPEQFRDNGGAERDLSGRFGQVDLHETRRFRGHRKAVKDRRDGVVPLGRHADAVRVERGEAVSRRVELAREVSAAFVAPERGRQGVRGRGSGQLRPDVGHQDLAVGELGEVLVGVGARDVVVDKGGGQGAEPRAVPGSGEGLHQVRRGSHGHQPVGAAGLALPRFGEQQPVSDLVEAGVRPVVEFSAQVGVPLDRLGQGPQVVHVQAGVPPVAAQAFEPQAGAGRRWCPSYTRRKARTEWAWPRPA